ncbi:uncharacterized protein LOC134187874 [Corticium candelabrum]|uniref:uncharacterized protein LOC134187874 n=1 Tax=Corticium candelabrum TaxID=121492 RepID=UPI002E27550A|nr:uncharacterized protein LOC134187874 [Corticium candelabrum]
MLTVLDYAGQNVFYVTHHLIMSKAGFMYIVFNASLPMDGKTPCMFRSEDGTIIHIPLFDNETNFDRLEEWVSGVHIMEGDQSRRIMIFEKVGIRSPAMFLVGTHADELKEQPGMMEKQDAFIRKKLEGTVLAEHIIWASKDVMCFYVDNTVTDPDSGFVDPQVKLLRQKTEEVAHKVAQHHRLPIRWLKYEQKVREVKVSSPTKKTTTVDELLQLAMNAAGIKSREELLVLLQYLSSRAVLMYHPMALKSGDDEEVVLDVEWFVSQLQKVITIYMEGDVPPMLWNDVKRSKEKGIMTMSLVRHLLSDAGSAQRLIVSLMRHYDLLCEYSVLEEENMEEANCQDFLSFDVESKGPLHSEEEQNMFERDACFIPCLLEHAVGLESDKMNDELKSLPLILSSAPIRIPQPLFYRILTLLCKRFCRLAVIYRNVGYFHIYPGHRLEFALNRYNFQMTVLSHTALNAKVCVAIREWIVNAVNKAKQQGMAGLKLHLGFMYEASTSESQSCTVEFIFLDGYQHTRFELYSSVTKDEIQPPNRLSLWYPHLKFSDTEMMSTVCGTSQPLQHKSISYMTPVKFLIDEPNAACLLAVSKLLDEDDDLGDDWRRLWPELLNRPLNEDVVSKKCVSPTLYVLKRWCRMVIANEATIGRLIKALSAIYRNDVACVLEEYCQSSDTCTTMPRSPAATDVTPEELNHLSEVIQGCWQEFAATLAPDLFEVTGKLAAIKSEHASPLLQAQAMLESWRNKVGAKAHRSVLIKTLIKRGLRTKANEVFGQETVLQVSPQ